MKNKTNIEINQDTRKSLQILKQEGSFKNVNQVLQSLMGLSKDKLEEKE